MSIFKVVRVFVNDMFLCTMSERKVDQMLKYLRSRGITNVTICE
jgi:hypothetical protein